MQQNCSPGFRLRHLRHFGEARSTLPFRTVTVRQQAGPQRRAVLVEVLCTKEIQTPPLEQYTLGVHRNLLSLPFA